MSGAWALQSYAAAISGLKASLDWFIAFAVLIARIYVVSPLLCPLWEDYGDAQIGEGVEVEPDWNLVGQPAPDYEIDQRLN
jgi:hypothetical protein